MIYNTCNYFWNCVVISNDCKLCGNDPQQKWNVYYHITTQGICHDSLWWYCLQKPTTVDNQRKCLMLIHPRCSISLVYWPTFTNKMIQLCRHLYRIHGASGHLLFSSRRCPTGEARWTVAPGWSATLLPRHWPLPLARASVNPRLSCVQDTKEWCNRSAYIFECELVRMY